MRFIHCALSGLAFAAVLLVSTVPAPAAPSDRPASARTEFNRDIRPLFAKHCTACHGGVKAAGKLSLVYRDKVIAPAKSGEVPIIPGDPDKSEIIRRVLSTDEDEVMPRPDHGPRLSEKEIATLRQWIKEGAKWSEHWSFVPPAEPAKPTLKNKSWPKVPADQFILAPIEAAGLKPSPEATPAEWLRRVSLDLIGLPPTPEDYDVFLKDRRKNAAAAKARVVDRLLASPQFGERWASVWLDLARYSDTFGFEKDPHRDIWPWRDWVIRAFNADLPFDQFTIKQLAGDLLPNPTANDILATAFHRNTQNNTEGGTDDEEYRTVAVLDRVNTTWTTWNATTFGCVQCHAHPYDPYPHRDYYRFAAFFDNTEDCDQNDDYPRWMFPEDTAKREEAARLQRESRRLREKLNTDALPLAAKVTDWKALVAKEAKASGGTLTIGANGRIDASGTLPISVKYTNVVPAIAGMTALKIDIFPESNNPKNAPERGQIFSKLTASLVVPGASNQIVKLKDVIVDYYAGPFDPRKVLEGGGGLGSYPTMSGPRWGIIVLEKPLEAAEGAALELVFDHGIAANSSVQGCPLKHFALSYSKDVTLTDFANSAARSDALAEWRAAGFALKKLSGTNVPVMVERTKSAARETRVFIRGNRLTRDDAVLPGIPDVVQPPKTSDPMNRLDMARWIVSDRNPLAARVLANRLWAEMFGRGIVETLEDFGTSGAKPSHPELLDHLALRLRGEFKWSVKQFLRELALSATYAQTAKTTPILLEKDAANHLLARGPRSRLTAEMVRDQALAVSGLLSTKQFGPPVYPPQPDGIWSTVYSGDKWNTATNENRFRRAVYTYSRRTAGYPLFLTFDAPMRDFCTARRIPSNTPLQALSVMNDPAFIEMAQALATRMEKDGGPVKRKIERGCRLLMLDKPPRAMIDSLVKLYEGALTDYRADKETAARLGETPEKAALVLVANTLLNLDSSLTR
ncbi:MAG: DUF1549 domain-containing protein [Verrucomicrobia bacterium]|nr:DUF1549 domain-containing protein [Verrucomicrobiota bacterium]